MLLNETITSIIEQRATETVKYCNFACVCAVFPMEIGCKLNQFSMLYIILCIYTQILPKQFHISAHTNMAKHTQYAEMLRPENNSGYLAALVTQAWQPCKRTVCWTYTGVCLEIRFAWCPVYCVQFLYVQDKRWPASKNSGDVFGRSSETAVSCCTVREFQRGLLKWPNGV